MRESISEARRGINRATMRLAIHVIRALESILPPQGLQILIWPAAAVMSGWELAWGHPTVQQFGQLPSSLRPAGSLPGRIWRLWRQRINLNLTKLLVAWPDRLVKPRWRDRCDGAALERLNRLSAHDQPMVLAVLHYGPLTVLKYWMRAHGLAVAGLVERPLTQRPAYRVYLDNLNDTASGFGRIPHLFDVTQVRQAVQFIQRDRLLMVAVEGYRGHLMCVEGEDYSFRMATGVIRLAATAKALVVPCLTFAHRPFGFMLHVGKPVPTDGDLHSACAHLMHEFIPILKAHPEQCDHALIQSFLAPAPAWKPAVEWPFQNRYGLDVSAEQPDH